MITERTYVFEADKLISTNNQYICMRKGAPFLSPQGRRYKEYIKKVMDFSDKNYYNNTKLIEKPRLIMESITFLLTKEQFIFQNGSLKRRDLTNFIKLIEDAIFDYLGFGDQYVIRQRLDKKMANFNGGIITLSIDEEDTIESLNYEEAIEVRNRRELQLVNDLIFRLDKTHGYR